MIEVNVSHSEENRVLHITIMGHAGYGNPGEDIVCAAVSALAIGALNSTERLLGINLQPISDDGNGGVLSWNIPQESDRILDDQLQLLMKALVESLKMIEDDYHEFINVNIKSSHSGGAV